MAKPVSSVRDIVRVLPDVQKTVKAEIAIRVAAGEKIASFVHPIAGKGHLHIPHHEAEISKSGKRKSAA